MGWPEGRRVEQRAFDQLRTLDYEVAFTSRSQEAA
jgi:hypothetical protein